MAIAYYGVRLPDKKNWVETPEGYVIFQNAVIGRTGFQRYKGYELDQDELMEQGCPVKDSDDVELFRSADEVFSPATIASFVGKSVTDGHPSELLSIENVRDHEEGQIINVHRGNDPLESGDYPLLADLLVKSNSLIDKIKAGLRELSCGYNYHVLKDGQIIKQVDIIGNHVAVVENARAGREAVIVDAVPVTSTERFNIMNWLDSVFSTNRKAKLVSWAKDAKPEEVVEAIEALGKQLDERPEVVTRVTVKEDVKPDPEKERMHLALDKALNGEDEDVDVKMLKALFDKSADKPGEDQKEEEEEEKEKKKGEDQEEEESEGTDESSLVIEPSDRPTASLGPGTDSDAIIAARVDGAKAVLKQLKPLIAKSGNKKLIAAYDATVRTVVGKSKVSSPGGYGVFVEASNTRGKDAQDSVEQSNNKQIFATISAAEALYKERFNVVKR